MPSLIPLFDQTPDAAGGSGGAGPRILQLYQDLELFSEGDPPANTLFVLGRSLGVAADQVGLWRDQLLVIDPPPDLSARFRLEGDVAVLATAPHSGEHTGGAAEGAGFPRVQTIPGGAAHIRVGEQFLDIYAQAAGAIVHLPALGIVLGGVYGSDVVPPRLAPAAAQAPAPAADAANTASPAGVTGLTDGGIGDEALDSLRLIARLLKRHHFQLYIPHTGSLCEDKLAVMQRLAADVAYVHGLRRVLPALVQRGEPRATLEAAAASLLPAAMQTPAAQAVHAANLQLLYTAASGHPAG